MDWLWVRYPLEEMKYLLKFIFPFLRSATQHAIPPEFGRKWGTEYLITRFSQPTLLCAGYNVKLKLISIITNQKKRTPLFSINMNMNIKKPKV